jgi:hypothetical protein
LELVSPETLLPATTVPVLLIQGRDNRNKKNPCYEGPSGPGEIVCLIFSIG